MGSSSSGPPLGTKCHSHCAKDMSCRELGQHLSGFLSLELRFLFLSES